MPAWARARLTGVSPGHSAACDRWAVVCHGPGWDLPEQNANRNVTLDRDTLRFRSAARSFAVPALDIAEFSWPGQGRASGGYVRLRTRAGDVIKLPSRLKHMIELLIELHQVNPEAEVRL
jgi:hypothetical protein